MLIIDPHPLLDVRAFVTVFPQPIAQSPSSRELLTLLALDAAAPLHSDDKIREQIRELLRHGGFKPAGRSKPASEYLIKAVHDKALSSINLAVDACNVVSLHSGLPISVVDMDLLQEPVRVGIGEEGSSYVFNASGQVLDVKGLLCLFDAGGPCGSAVKDSQRTKTRPETVRTLSLIWGTKRDPERTKAAEKWYRELLGQTGARTESV